MWERKSYELWDTTLEVKRVPFPLNFPSDLSGVTSEFSVPFRQIPEDVYQKGECFRKMFVRMIFPTYLSTVEYDIDCQEKRFKHLCLRAERKPRP